MIEMRSPVSANGMPRNRRFCSDARHSRSRSSRRSKHCDEISTNGSTLSASQSVTGATLDNDPAHLQLRLEGQSAAEQPFIILLRRGGQLRCIAPFYIKQCPYQLRIGDAVLGSLPALPVRMILLFGGRGEIIFAADENVQECAETIVKVLWQHRSQFDMVCLENLDTSSALWNYCRTQLSQTAGFRSFAASRSKVLQIQLPPTYEDYLKRCGQRSVTTCAAMRGSC